MNADDFEIRQELIDVTSLSRPDTSWRFVDAAGHVHQWQRRDGQPVDGYRPEVEYHVPTVEWVKTGESWCEDDGEPYDVGQLECTECRAVVKPSTCADSFRQAVAGHATFFVNGHLVSRGEFERQWSLAVEQRVKRTFTGERDERGEA